MKHTLTLLLTLILVELQQMVGLVQLVVLIELHA
jgi:hypothetical protein